jgi:hypothetical protein
MEDQAKTTPYTDEYMEEIVKNEGVTSEETSAKETSGVDLNNMKMDPEDIKKLMDMFRSRMPGNGKQQKKRTSQAKRKAKRKSQKAARKKNRK